MKTRTLVHTLALTCALLTLPAFAQTDGTWTQTASGTHAWSNTDNWAGGTVAGGTDATASFTVNPAGAQTVNLDTAVTLGSLILDRDQNLTIQGPGTLALDVTTGIPIVEVRSGRTVALSTVLAGSDGLRFQGGGRLNLVGLDNANPNTLTGGITVIGGIVEVVEVRANSIGNGPISLSEGGSLLLRGGNTSTSQVSVGTGGGLMQNRGNNHYITTGILTGSGTLTYGNAGGAGGRSLQFNSTANDFTGGFVLTGNLLTIQVNSLADSNNNIAFTGGGNFRYGSGAITALTLNDRAFRLNNSNGNIDNANSAHAITINTDLIATGGGGKTLTLSGSAGPTNVFAGNIADETDGGDGTVALTKSGASTWVLSGQNTYSGITTVSAGTLALRGDGSLPHVGTLNIAGGKVDIEGKARVAELQYAGGESLPHGIYGSTDSSAENQNDDRFSGTGVLYVGVPFPPSGTVILL